MRILVIAGLCLASLAAEAATQTQIQTCSVNPLPATPRAGALVGCPTPVLFGPKYKTDLVRVQQASAGNAQKWIPYSQVAAADKVVQKTDGQWVTFSSIQVTPAPVDKPTSGTGTGSTTPPVVTGAQLSLSWKPPTQNTDGSALTDLAGYNVYQGNTVLTALMDPTVTSYKTSGLAVGSYQFSVTAVNKAGVESAHTQTVTGTVTAIKPPAPGVPGSLTVTVIVPTQ
jgi:hypothetical protein